ncbi:hypothetical protein AB4142_32005, partial [Variovorax sp. 2RAF20]
ATNTQKISSLQSKSHTKTANNTTNTKDIHNTAFSRRSLLPNRIPAVTAIMSKITTNSNIRIIHNLQLHLKLQLWIAVIDKIEHKC